MKMPCNRKENLIVESCNMKYEGACVVKQSKKLSLLFIRVRENTHLTVDYSTNTYCT